MAKTALCKNTGSKYNDEQRRQAIGVYIVTGNYAETAKQMNMPKRTVHDWSKREWWLSLVEQVRSEKQDELDSQITGSINRALKSVNDRLDLGDEYIKKDGTTGYKAVSCRDSATVLGILYDKRALIRNMPTSITSNTDSDKLLKLKEQFEQLAQEKIKQIEASVVSEG